MDIDAPEVEKEVKDACRRVALDAETRAEIVDIVVSKFIDSQHNLEPVESIKKDTNIESEDAVDMPPSFEPVEVVENALNNKQMQETFDQVNIYNAKVSKIDGSLRISFARDFEHKGLNPDIVFDCQMCVLGRVASEVSERALSGERIVLLNVEDIVVTGNEQDVIDKYRKRNRIGSDSGPYFPKQPDGIVKRAIRGMLPHKDPRGQEALENIRAYIGTPSVYEGDAKVPAKDMKVTLNPMKNKDFVKIGHISTSIGAEQRW